LLNNIAGVLAPYVATPTGDFESIQTTVVGAGGASSITFSSIPSTYKNLQIRAILRSAGASNASSSMQFNGDTAANYSSHSLTGDGASASAGASVSASNIGGVQYWTNTSLFSTEIIDILDYANTNKYKTTRMLAGVDGNGSGYVTLTSGNWRSTAAISSIVINVQGANNFAQYSSFALYGIKG